MAALSNADPTEDAVAQPGEEADAGGKRAASEAEQPNATPVKQDSPKTPAVAGSVSDGGRRAGRSKGKREDPAPRAKGARLKTTILLKLDEELKDRMVNTVEWTGPRTGLRTQQLFIRRAIADLCDRLEKDLNSGQPFDPIVEAPDS